MPLFKPLLFSTVIAAAALLAGCGHHDHHHHSRHRDYGWRDDHCRDDRPRYIYQDRGRYDRHDHWRR